MNNIDSLIDSTKVDSIMENIPIVDAPDSTTINDAIDFMVTSLPTINIGASYWLDYVVEFIAAIAPIIAILIAGWQIKEQLKENREQSRRNTLEKSKQYFCERSLEKREEIMNAFCDIIKKQISQEEIDTFQYTCLKNYVYLNQRQQDACSQMVTALVTALNSNSKKVASGDVVNLLGVYTEAWKEEYQGDTSQQ